MTISNFLAQAALDDLVNANAYTPPTTVYANAWDADAGAEATGVTRQPIAFGAATTGTPSTTAVITQGAEVDLGNMPGGIQASLEGVVLFDAATGGNQMALDTSVTFNTSVGSRLFIPAGAVSLSIANTALETTWKVAILDWLFRNQTRPGRITHFGYFDGSTARGTRVSTSSWFGAASLADPSVVTQSALQVYEASATFAGACNAYRLFSQLSGGTARVTQSLTSAFTVNTGDTVNVNAGCVQLSLT